MTDFERHLAREHSLTWRQFNHLSTEKRVAVHTDWLKRGDDLRWFAGLWAAWKVVFCVLVFLTGVGLTRKWWC